MTDRLGRADLHIHTLASDGTAGVVEILDHVERNTELDVIAITDHERIDAALAGRVDRPRPRAAVRGRRRRGGHDARRPPARALDRDAGQAVPVAARDHRRDPRPGRHRHPRPPARPVPAVRPGLRAAPAARRRPALPAGRDRGVQPDDARQAVARARGPLRQGARSRARGQLRRPRPRRDRHRPHDLPGPRRRGPPGARSWAGRPQHHGSFHPAGQQLGTFGKQLRKYGRDARAELGRPAPARRHAAATSATRATAAS